MRNGNLSQKQNELFLEADIGGSATDLLIILPASLLSSAFLYISNISNRHGSQILCSQTLCHLIPSLNQKTGVPKIGVEI